MKAGSSIRPQKAQVKDKGLGAKSGDFRGTRNHFLSAPNLRVIAPGLGSPSK